ncbi:MAG TPA: Hpt domain-containing protein [Luteimonas sp.]|nr:Hpt domain-containing protein [Luteimonas sp.]
MTAGASLDPGALATLRALDADNPGAFSGFVRMFIAEVPDLIRRIETASDAADPAALAQAAHYLRSASLALGATELAEVCYGLEHPHGEVSAVDREKHIDRLRHSVRDALLALLMQVSQI